MKYVNLKPGESLHVETLEGGARSLRGLSNMEKSAYPDKVCRGMIDGEIATAPMDEQAARRWIGDLVWFRS